MDNAHNKKIDNDQKEIVDFLSFLKAASFNYLSLYSNKYFQWKIQNNPFGKSFSFIRYVGNKPAASASITSKPLNNNLQAGIFLAELGDTHTHPEFQRQGHFGNVGNKVINHFDKQTNNSALIFGIPNANAVHGWQSRCNCELLDSLNIGEYILGPKLRISFLKKSKIKELTSKDVIINLVNDIWRDSYKNKIALVKKDSHWWKWRYDISPEHYRIFSLTSDDKSHKAYLVAKFSRKFLFFLQIDICDVVGVSEKLEVNILKNFIQRFSSPFSKIRIWSKGSSKAEALLKSFSFSLDKKINFVLFKNFGYKFITEHNINFTLDLGDTDNT